MSELKNIIEESFKSYAAHVIQQRAIIDVRDAIKPSARMCFYAQKLSKIDAKHHIQPSPNSIGEAIKRFYTHGDTSCYSLLMRYAKDYAVRYPLIEVEGSIGSLEKSNTEPAARYTKMRLNELGTGLFEGIEKNSIDVWFNNYAETEKYPSVLPSLGYYNIVNGTTGIAIGMSSSIPQFNLKEVNNALIKLLWNPEVSFDEIYCKPDFATGATIINEEEVKNSLRIGNGKSCKIRATIEWNEKERCLIVSEIPYGVYTSTICKEISNYMEENLSNGISKFLDLTGKTALIKIYLTKTANTQRIIKNLYKHTSLQSHFGINMTMLDNGQTPKVFGWKEALLAHLEHEKATLRKIFEFDLQKVLDRLHIVDAILIAIANMEEIIQIIRGENSTAAAKEKLCERFGFSIVQAEAILNIKLAKLVKLEAQSFVKEKENLLVQKSHYENLLENEKDFNKKIEEQLILIRDKYGDERRTKCINLTFESEDEDAEPIEKKELIIYYTNNGNLLTQESTTLLTKKRNQKGKNIKLTKGETIVETISDSNYSNLFVFTNLGKMYTIDINELPIGQKVNAAAMIEMDNNEKITKIVSCGKKDLSEYIIFITKNGLIKKSKSSDYNIKKGKSLKAINLKENDEVVNVMFTGSKNIGILTNGGNFIIIETKNIAAIGRTTAGRKAIKLNEGDFVLCSEIVGDGKFIIAATRNGLIKKTKLEEFGINNIGVKGQKIQKIQDGDQVISFKTLMSDDEEIGIISSNSILNFATKEVSTSSRTAVGVKCMKLNENEKIIKVL